MPNYSTSASQKVAGLWTTDHALADEGALFVATNPTPGTPIATTTSITSETQASPVMVIQNGWAPSDPNAKNIYLQYLRMLVSQVPTSATSWQMTIRSDSNPAAYTSGGSQITPQNVNVGSGITSKANIYFGNITAVTTAGQAAARLISRVQVNPVVPVTTDQWNFIFGTMGIGSDQISGGAAAKNVVFALPSIIIPPGYNVRIYQWGASNAAAPSWEFELGYAERVGGL